MCGFAGIVDLARESSHDALDALAQAMVAPLAHRGPDDAGTWVDAPAGIALGFRRLAIVDLSAAGHQPMVSASGRFVIAFNGEIYNHRELRRELAASGHSFRGHSDTEILLTAIEAWGVRPALDRANGMFAFAIWDRDQRRLTLARDRIGEKPLYYARRGRQFAFGSELASLRIAEESSPRIDRGALTEYLRYGWIPGEQSILDGVAKLQPGCILTLDTTAAAGTPQIGCYWSATEVATRQAGVRAEVTRAESADQLDALLRDAVARRMIADVPVGVFLSGGIDSSAIAALVQATTTDTVRTFTIGFKEASHDEAPHARAIAAHLGTEHTEMDVTAADALDVIPSLPGMFGEPFADPSAIPTHLLARLTREHVTVSLSGDGGDELFGGYDRYVRARRMWGIVGRVPASPRAAAAGLIVRGSPARWDALAGAVARTARRPAPRDVGHKVHRGAALLSASSRADLYQQLISYCPDPQALLASGGPAPAAWNAPADLDFVEQMMLWDLTGYLPEDILVKLDRTTMAASLEGRVPFLDHRIVEFAWSLPSELRLAGSTGKQVLRDVLARYVPRELFERPKMGFGVPIDEWLRGPLRAWADALLDPTRLREQGLLDPVAVRDLWEEHLAGTRNWQYALWVVLMLQAWIEETGISG